jgi:hypothetical protein
MTAIGKRRDLKKSFIEAGFFTRQMHPLSFHARPAFLRMA